MDHAVTNEEDNDDENAEEESVSNPTVIHKPKVLKRKSGSQKQQKIRGTAEDIF